MVQKWVRPIKNGVIVFHPKVAGGRMSFHDAIGQNMLILTQIFNNTLSSVKSPDDNNSHAVTLFGFDQNNFQIKNSYFAQKLVKVNSQLPVYSEFINYQQRFRQMVTQNIPTFSDQNYILYDQGYCVQFKNKLKRFVKFKNHPPPPHLNIFS